jgi:CheY-like chemotaxis protein
VSFRDPELASLAHDLSQLLWAIQGRARALASGETGERAGSLARIAEDAAAAADMLAGEGRGPCRVRDVLVAAFQQAIDAVPEASDDGHWQLALSGGEHGAALAASSLRRILANLLTNAMQASPEGGQLDVRAERTDDDQLVISVQDNGPGIPEHLLPRLFSPGATAGKSDGHGIGLAGARDLARRHGGELEHVPTPTGALFRLTVPAAETPATEVSTAPDAGSHIVAPARLLVVDDDASVRLMLEEMLAVDGHELTLVADHDSALAKMQAGRYDAALVDVGLPGRSGHDLAANLRARDPALAIVLITGWGRERELPDAPTGAVDFTGTKPLDQPILRDLLARAVALTARRRQTSTEA